jgi:hypothetical protein
MLQESGEQLVKKKRITTHFSGVPKVHSGFLSCWYSNGMDTRVLKMAETLIKGSFDSGKLKVYLTGECMALGLTLGFRNKG